MSKRLRSAKQVTLGFVLLMMDECAYGEPGAWMRQRMRRLPGRVAHHFKG
jgi:hypothetical protein